MTLRHFIDTQDFTKQELLDMIELTRRIKAADKQGCTPKLLEGASLAMIFEEPSTRTRVSFEVAMTELGGHALYLKPGEIHLGVRESMYDTAKVLSRMCDAIFCRALKHETVTELAKHADVPVINGLTDQQIINFVDCIPKHGHAGGHHERAYHQRSNAFELAVAVGVFIVGRLAGQAHENACHHVIGHVGGGVDTLCQQRRAVTDDANGHLERREQNIGSQTQVDHLDTAAIALF